MTEQPLIEFLRVRLNEDEQWALAASKPCPYAEGHTRVPAGGLHWRWGVGPDWDPVEIDPAVQEFVDEDADSCVLLSVETWQSTTSPNWVLPRRYGSVEEMDAAAAAHIVRHDPARVLREVEAKRRMIAECEATIRQGLSMGLAETMLAMLAEPYQDHPDYPKGGR